MTKIIKLKEKKKNKRVAPIRIIKSVEVKKLSTNIWEFNYKGNTNNFYCTNENDLYNKVNCFKNAIDVNNKYESNLIPGNTVNVGKLSNKVNAVIQKMDNNHHKDPRPFPFKSVDVVDKTQNIFNKYLEDVKNLMKTVNNDKLEDKTIKISNNLSMILSNPDGNDIPVKGLQINNKCYYQYMYDSNKKENRLDSYIYKFVKEFIINKVTEKDSNKLLKEIFKNTRLSYTYGLYFEKFNLVGNKYSYETLEDILNNYVDNKFYLHFDLKNIYDNKIHLYENMKHSKDNFDFDLIDFTFSDKEKLLKSNHLKEFIYIFSIFYHNIKKRFNPENIAINELLSIEKAKTVHYSKDGLTYTTFKDTYGLSMYRVFNLYIKEFKAKYLKYKNKIYDLTVFED